MHSAEGFPGTSSCSSLQWHDGTLSLLHYSVAKMHKKIIKKYKEPVLRGCTNQNNCSQVKALGTWQSSTLKQGNIVLTRWDSTFPRGVEVILRDVGARSKGGGLPLDPFSGPCVTEGPLSPIDNCRVGPATSAQRARSNLAQANLTRKSSNPCSKRGLSHVSRGIFTIIPLPSLLV